MIHKGRRRSGGKRCARNKLLQVNLYKHLRHLPAYLSGLVKKCHTPKPHRLSSLCQMEEINLHPASVDAMFSAKRGLGTKRVGDVTRKEGRQAEVGIPGILTVLACTT